MKTNEAFKQAMTWEFTWSMVLGFGITALWKWLFSAWSPIVFAVTITIVDQLIKAIGLTIFLKD
jgi:hypothetical protein